jgi:hypothetical protein
MADPDIPISEIPMPESPTSENPISGYLISGSGGGDGREADRREVQPIAGEADQGPGEVSPTADDYDRIPGDVDRRAVLKALSGTAALAVAGPAFAIPLASEDRSRYAMLAEQTRAALPGSPAKKFSFQAVRAEDMLYLAFEFYNCKRVVRHGQTFVVPLTPTIPSLMVVIFQPQHIGEQSVKASSTTKTYPFPPLHGALAGKSWLAFELPKHAAIPLTIEGLLTWAHLTPQLVPVVASPSTGFPAAPDPVHSALEVPWGLWISPPKNGTWQHAVAPVSSGGRTELWHTRLGVHGVEPPHATPRIKAFWSTTAPTDPFFMPLSPTDRNDIVALTCGTVAGGGPAKASLLALSPLGASINIQGEWNPNPGSGVSLKSWIHRASLGRDSYVRVVNLGYLFPFGNRAVKIKITDREFHADPNGDVVAFLVTRVFIVVTQPTITYTGDPNEPFNGRGNPIRQVTIKTVSTPPIDFDPSTDPGIQVGSFGPSVVLWVRSGEKDIPFACTLTDIEGRTVDITTSVIWIDGTLTDMDSIDSIATVYDTAGAARNTPAFGGAMFAFAETDGAPVGSTAHHVDTYTLTAQFAANNGPNFYPMLNNAQIRLPGAEQLVGAGAPSATGAEVPAVSTSLPSPSVFIHDHYKTNGFPAGVTEVYLAILNNAPSLGFPVNLVGGLIPPNFDMKGLARDIGPVAGDLTELLNGMFDPTKYFSVLSGGIGKLLGAIDIADIISGVGVVAADDPSRSAQARLSRHERPGAADIEQPDLSEQRQDAAADRARHQAHLAAQGQGRPVRHLQAEQLQAADHRRDHGADRAADSGQLQDPRRAQRLRDCAVRRHRAVHRDHVQLADVRLEHRSQDLDPAEDRQGHVPRPADVHPGSRTAAGFHRRAVDRRVGVRHHGQLLTGPAGRDGRGLLAQQPVDQRRAEHPVRRLAGTSAIRFVHPGQPVPAHRLDLRRRRLLLARARRRRDRGTPG